MDRLSRKERGVTQNLFLIEMKSEKEYIVMGSTGNIYTVIIKDIPSCSCPDFVTRNKRCKHIYFVLIRVMKTIKEDQSIYSDNELMEMYSKIPQITNNLFVDKELKSVYEKFKLQLDCGQKEVTIKNTDDVCPICLDDLENGDDLDYCKYSCGKFVHKICYGMWCKKNKATCIFCRADWNNKKVTPYINIKKK